MAVASDLPIERKRRKRSHHSLVVIERVSRESVEGHPAGGVKQAYEHFAAHAVPVPAIIDDDGDLGPALIIRRDKGGAPITSGDTTQVLVTP